MKATVRALTWFVAFALVAFVVVDHDLDTLRGLIAAGPDEAAARGAGGGPLPATAGVAGGAAVAGAEQEPPLAAPRHGGERRPFSGQAIEDPCLDPTPDPAGPCRGRAMDGFYRALARLERGEPGATAHVLHLGDSIIAVDNVSARLRSQLQTSFGDGGAGFLYVGQPSRWYERRGIRHESENWIVRSVTRDGTSDRRYGLGGAAFDAAAGGATALFATAKRGELGDRVSRFEVAYLEQPGGGKLDILADGRAVARVDTGAAQGGLAHSGFHAIELPDGPHTLQLKVAGGRVRTYGVVLERGAGLVYDVLGLVSSSARKLAAMDGPHWEEQLVHRRGDLVIVFLGANEADWTATSAKAIADYQALFEELLGRIRHARPDGACLVMSPLDSASDKHGTLETKATIPLLVAAQRRAASARGCAFWDSFTWMGGEGTAVKWLRHGLISGYYVHPTRAGAAKVADALFEALMHGYERYQDREAGRP